MSRETLFKERTDIYKVNGDLIFSDVIMEIEGDIDGVCS